MIFRLDFLKFLFHRIWVSIRHVPVTVEYPFVAKALPPLAKARLKNFFSECTGCLECERLCPLTAIAIESMLYSESGRPATTKGIPCERSISSFKIDYSRCTMCGICVSICPTQSLVFDKVFPQPQPRALDLTVDLVHLPRTMRRTDA